MAYRLRPLSALWAVFLCQLAVVLLLTQSSKDAVRKSLEEMQALGEQLSLNTMDDLAFQTMQPVDKIKTMLMALSEFNFSNHLISSPSQGSDSVYDEEARLDYEYEVIVKSSDNYINDLPGMGENSKDMIFLRRMEQAIHTLERFRQLLPGINQGACNPGLIMESLLWGYRAHKSGDESAGRASFDSSRVLTHGCLAVLENKKEGYTSASRLLELADNLVFSSMQSAGWTANPSEAPRPRSLRHLPTSDALATGVGRLPTGIVFPTHGNPIDGCWLKLGWHGRRKAFAECSVGYGANGGSGLNPGFYIVHSAVDNDAGTLPSPGTLRHAVERIGGAGRCILVYFLTDLTIKLKSALRLPGCTTIDGRGQEITISGHPLILVQVEDVAVTNIRLDVEGTAETDLSAKSEALTVGIQLVSARRVWLDHLSIGGTARGRGDGKARLGIHIEGCSDLVTISNCRFYHREVAVMLTSTGKSSEENAHITVAYSYFDTDVAAGISTHGGTFHVLNNYFNQLQTFPFVVDNAANIWSDGNVYVARSPKPVAASFEAHSGDEACGEDGTWVSSEDRFENGAFFVPFGGTKKGLSYLYKQLPASHVLTALTNVGQFPCEDVFQARPYCSASMALEKEPPIPRDSDGRGSRSPTLPRWLAERRMASRDKALTDDLK